MADKVLRFNEHFKNFKDKYDVTQEIKTSSFQGLKGKVRIIYIVTGKQIGRAHV